MTFEDMMAGLSSGSVDPAAVAGVMAVMGAMMFVVAILVLAIYIYSALAMMITAKRLKTPLPWLAWIPIANAYLLSQMAKMPWWPILLLAGAFIPMIGFLFGIAFAVFQIIWLWKVCEKRSLPGWFAVLTIIPFAGWVWGLVLWGMLAWGK